MSRKERMEILSTAAVTPLDALPHVRGHCPMGCGETLRLASGIVICTGNDCARRASVMDILADGETEHIVAMDVDGFTIRHPLRERLDDDLLRCGLHRYLATWTGIRLSTGRYRAGHSANGWAFEPLARS